MSRRLAILGGSTPFTIALIDAFLPVVSECPPHSVLLYGRNPANLELIARYARQHLSPHGWQVTETTKLAEALQGADVVLHQIRYGDLEVRHAGERLCAQFKVAADETLGPAALLTLLASLPELQQTCAALVRYCPTAWVLNVTNPLSAVTAMMAGWGVRKCIGTCELPVVTAHEVSAVLGAVLSELEWNYRGLNHRGFLYNIKHRAIPVFGMLISQHGNSRIGGLRVSAFRELGAIPLKYFALVTGQRYRPRPRAMQLMRLKDQLLAELREDALRSPPSLNARPMPWYALAIVPLILALNKASPSQHVVTVVDERGVGVETPAWIDCHGVQPIPQPSPPTGVADWITRFETHELALLAALRSPSLDAVSNVAACDPVCAGSCRGALTAAIWQAITSGRQSGQPRAAADTVPARQEGGVYEPA